MRCRWTFTWLVSLLVCLPPALHAQSTGSAASGEPIVIGHRTSIRSTVLGEDRPLLIYTPPGYEQSTEAFPVLYLLDGDGHFHHASGLTQFLAANRRMPAMIVVGVPNLTQEGRTHDLTPPLTIADTANQFPTAGGGSDFLKFLTNELQPWVESHYRTQPYRILVGHSFGGLFATQALIEDPDAFEAYLAISPSLWWDDGRFVEKAASVFEKDPDLKGAWYMTMGDEGGTMLAGAWSLASILETKAPESFRWKWTHMPQEDHGSVPHRSLYDGLEWLFDGWNLPEAFTLAMDGGADGWVTIRAHYAKLSEQYGFEVQMPEDLVNQIGYVLLQQKRIDDAIRAFEMNTEMYPTSANVYDSLGDAYDAACRWPEAAESYGRAYRMAQEASLPNTGTYKANLDRMTAKIESGEKCTAAGAGGGPGQR